MLRQVSKGTNGEGSIWHVAGIDTEQCVSLTKADLQAVQSMLSSWQTSHTAVCDPP
jgi:hypothetical protein